MKASKKPVKKWSMRELKEHRDMLRRKKMHIQGRIDALEEIIEDKEESIDEAKL